MNSALLSSKKMDYCTPQGFFDTLNAEFHFTLDAAAPEKSAKCKNFYTPETDGLTAPWNIGGGQRILQPAVWPGAGRVGAQSLRGGAGRNNGGSADTGKDRHGLLPRLHIRESGNPLFAWAAAL